jgi:hypothetical protein
MGGGRRIHRSSCGKTKFVAWHASSHKRWSFRQ